MVARATLPRVSTLSFNGRRAGHRGHYNGAFPPFSALHVCSSSQGKTASLSLLILFFLSFINFPFFKMSYTVTMITGLCPTKEHFLYKAQQSLLITAASGWDQYTNSFY
jgi:hypothetical protein